MWNSLGWMFAIIGSSGFETAKSLTEAADRWILLSK
jgi:hypothetical protein